MSLSQERLSFPYRAWGMVLTVTCVGVMIFGFTVSSFFDTHMFPDAQVGFVRVLVVANLVITPLLVIWLYRREKRGNRQIVLEADAIATPVNGFRSRSVRVPYDVIENIRVTQFKSNITMHITHPGPAIAVPRSALDSNEAFDQLHAALLQRVRKAQGQ